MEFVHKSVLFEECMQMLDVKPGGIYIDGTLGGGGHSTMAAAQIKSTGVEQAKKKLINAIDNYISNK